MLELVQRGVERSFAHLQDVTRHRAQPQADRPAVERLQCEQLQQQQIEGALHKVVWFAHLGFQGKAYRVFPR